MTTNAINLSSLKCNNLNANKSVTTSASRIAAVANAMLHPIAWLCTTKPVRTLCEMYSGLLEERVTPLFTVHATIAQVAAFATIMPAELDVLPRLLCLAGFGLSLYKSKQAYLAGKPDCK